MDIKPKNMGKSIDDKIKAIVVPTAGSAKEDLERIERAIRYNKENELNVPYIISGIGPDTNIALGYLKSDKDILDFHPELYKYIMNNISGFIGMDILSLNSVQNILNTFPEGVSGTYAIVSYPMHLKRFERIIKRAQEKGKISKDVKIEFVPTSQSLKKVLYETLSIFKRRRDLNKI